MGIIFSSCFNSCSDDLYDSPITCFAPIVKTNLKKNIINIGIEFNDKNMPCEYFTANIVSEYMDKSFKSGMYYTKDKTYIKYEELIIYVKIDIYNIPRLVKFESIEFSHINERDILITNMSKGLIYDDSDDEFKNMYNLSIVMRPSSGYFLLARDDSRDIEIKINPSTKMFYE
jgi:hypothetical protein